MDNQKEKNIGLDAAVIRKVVDGDTDAFRELVERYQDGVYSYAYSITRNTADARDITQEVFIRFFRNMEQFDARRPLSPYLLTITVNTARNLFRKNKRLVYSEDWASYDQMEVLSGEVPAPADAIMAEERNDRVRLMLDRLPLRMREVCSLFYLSGNSCAEVAAILQTNENAVKVALHRARKKLLEISISEGCME